MKARSIKFLVREAEEFLSIALAEKHTPLLREMHLKATIAFAWFGLEGFVNLASSDFLSLKSLEKHERAFLEEKAVEFEHGNFLIRGSRKYPTRDKIVFLLARFGNYDLKTADPLWTKLRNLQGWRDSLVHPKENRSISTFSTKHASDAIDITKSIIRLVYKKVYRKTARL